MTITVDMQYDSAAVSLIDWLFSSYPDAEIVLRPRSAGAYIAVHDAMMSAADRAYHENAILEMLCVLADPVRAALL